MENNINEKLQKELSTLQDHISQLRELKGSLSEVSEIKEQTQKIEESLFIIKSEQDGSLSELKNRFSTMTDQVAEINKTLKSQVSKTSDNSNKIRDLQISLYDLASQKTDKTGDEIRKIKSDVKIQKKKMKSVFTLMVIVLIFNVLASVLLLAGFKYKNSPSRTKSDFVYEKTIKRCFQAENEQNFNDLFNLFSSDMKRYWDIKNPTYNQLKNRYDHIWSITKDGKSEVVNIKKVNAETFEVSLSHSYTSIKTNKYYTNSYKIHFVFDKYGKIIEIYQI